MAKLKDRMRGFVILIVLAVIATASVILATQLSSVAQAQGAEIRSGEEAKARDIAELCMGLADQYVVAYGTANPSSDFDLILDPDAISGDTDDYMPPDALLATGSPTLVQIPASAVGTKFRYKAFNVAAAATAGATAGTCFIRFDDNNDDSNTTLSSGMTSNTGSPPVTEGAGVDVPNRDRDRTIITTVIGVVPQQATAALTYAKAHARATVKRVRAMPIAVSTGQAIWAGGNVDFGTAGNVICGAVGGIQADSVSGNVCVCGQLNAQNAGSATLGGCAGCTQCASTAGSNLTAGPRPDPPVGIPPFTSVYQNDGVFTSEALDLQNYTPPAPATKTGTNVAASTFPAAVVLFRDAEQTNPTTGATYDDATSGYQGANATDVFVWDRFDNNAKATLTALSGATVTVAAGAVTDCTDTSALANLPRACKWSNGASLTGRPNTVTCTTTDESPCWKLVARLHDGGHTSNLDIDTSGSRGNRPDQTLATNDDAFTASAGALPNVKGTKAWSDFAPSSCTTCSSTNATVQVAGGNYTVTPLSTANGPHMFALIDTPTSASVTMAGAATEPAEKISVFTNASVTMGGNECCATCSCPGTCNVGSSYTAPTNGPGYLVRTPTSCSEATSGFQGFGYLGCPQFDLGQSSNCLIGGFVLTKTPGTIDCAGGGMPDPPCDHAGFCVKNNFTMVGDIVAAGTICAKNNLNVSGGVIETAGSMGFKNNTLSNANQLIALGSITVKNNNTFQFDGIGGSGANQGIATTMWIDAAW